MMSFLRKRNVKVLVCEKTDRLTRSRRDAVVIDEWVRANPEREVHFVKENFILNRDSRANEKFIWGIKVEVAQYYINNLSEEVRKGQREKIEQGWLPTKPPLGYKAVGEKGHKIHVIDDALAPLVRRMFELYATGEYPLSRLQKTMRKEGLRTRGGYSLARSRVADLLDDPFYTGQIRWNGTIHVGKHEPLITRTLYRRCQEIMHGRGSARYRTHLHLFKGLIRCKECGGLLTWETQKGIVYGHCSTYRSCVRRTWYKEADFEGLVARELSRFRLVQPQLAEWVRKALRELHADEVGHRDAAVRELYDRQTRLRQQQDMLYADRLERRITTEFYDMKRAEIEAGLYEILEDIKRHSEADKKYFELGINLFELSQQAPDIFRQASPEKKRRLLMLISGDVYDARAARRTVHRRVLYAFYRQEFRGDTCLGLEAKIAEPGTFAPSVNDSRAGHSLARRHENWSRQLPASGPELWNWVVGQAAETLLVLLAYCAARTIDAVQRSWERNSRGAHHAGELARTVGLDMAEWWVPTRESYFAHVSKALILEAVREGVSEKEADALNGLKKDPMVEHAERLLAGKRWLPAVLRSDANATAPRTASA